MQSVMDKQRSVEMFLGFFCQCDWLECVSICVLLCVDMIGHNNRSCLMVAVQMCVYFFNQNTVRVNTHLFSFSITQFSYV